MLPRACMIASVVRGNGLLCFTGSGFYFWTIYISAALVIACQTYSCPKPLHHLCGFRHHARHYACDDGSAELMRAFLRTALVGAVFLLARTQLAHKVGVPHWKSWC